jgi:uncharacterized protein YjbI with pentapeptide repeats
MSFLYKPTLYKPTPQQAALLPQRHTQQTQATVQQQTAPPAVVKNTHNNSPDPLSWPQWLAIAAGATSVYNAHKLYDRFIAPLFARPYYAQLQDTVINNPAQDPVKRNLAITLRYLFRIGQRKDGRPVLTLPTIVRSTQEGLAKHASMQTQTNTLRTEHTNNPSYYPSHQSPLAGQDNSNLRLPNSFMPPIAQLFKPTPNKGLRHTLWPGIQLHPPANLSGSYPNDVSHEEANLSNSHLPGVLFNNTNCKRANLAGANLPGANFTKTNLYKAFVKNAHLAGATFLDTTGLPSVGLEMAAPRMVNLFMGNSYPAVLTPDTTTMGQPKASKQATITHRNTQLNQPMGFTRQDLSQKNLQGLKAQNVDYMDTLFTGSDMRHADIRDKNSVRLLGANMARINGQHMQAQHQDFAAVPLWNSQLGGMNAQYADFTGTDLSIQQALAETALNHDQPAKAPPNFAGLTRRIGPKRVVVKRTDLTGANMRGQQLDGMNFSYCILDDLQVQPQPLTDKQAQVQYRDVMAYLRPFMLTHAEQQLTPAQLRVHLTTVPTSTLKTKLIDLAKGHHLDDTLKQLAQPTMTPGTANVLLANGRLHHRMLQRVAQNKIKKQWELAQEARSNRQRLSNRGTSFKGANLSHSSLKRINFSGLDLTGANLSHSDLEGAVFSDDTMLMHADLRHAKNINWYQIATINAVNRADIKLTLEQKVQLENVTIRLSRT